MIDSIHEIVRRQERDFVSGTTKISEHVEHSMNDTLERIDAYINSKHISGETDALGREKPFFNIVTSARNIWFRATDIDRSHIKVRATKSTDWLNSFIATAFLQQWMRKARFGVFLNEWGRTLATYGSAVVKTVTNEDGLHISVVPFNRLIIDTVDFDAAPKIEIIELSESQLRRRVETHGYDQEAVEAIIDAKSARETKDGQDKDNKDDFYKLYEVHGELPKALLTGKSEHENVYVQQMHVVSFVENHNTGKDNDYQDFTLYSGEEDKDPYRITHLIKEDGRTLARGAVEHLFEAQWMQNHTMKAVKDQLDLASKMIFQTADRKFVGRNVITDIEQGDIFIHEPNAPLTAINNQPHGVVEMSNYAVQWKQLGNEIVGISEAMLGAAPKSGTAWRQTEALLTESYSLFELMTENKGLAIEDMLREDVIPYIKTKLLNNTDEIVAELEAHDLSRVDRKFVKATVADKINKEAAEKVFNGEIAVLPDIAQAENDMQGELSAFGNKRYFTPSQATRATWKEQLKDIEWELEIDVTGEVKNTREIMATLNTALSVIANPEYAQNEQAQMVVGKILELTGAMSPLEIASMGKPTLQPVVAPTPEANQIQ